MEFKVQGAGFLVSESDFKIQGLGVMVPSQGFRVQGSGSRVWGLGLRVWGGECCLHHKRQSRQGRHTCGTLRVGPNHLFLILDLKWRSPEFGGVWYK